MDHATNYEHNAVIIYNAHTTKGQLIKLMLQAKGRAFQLVNNAPSYFPEEKEPLIDDRSIIVWGMHNIFEFLEHKYPAPSLSMTSPEDRAHINMVFDAIIEEFYDRPINLESLMQYIPEDSFIITDRPTILDLAIYPVAPDTPPWSNLKGRIDAFLEKQQ